MDVVAPCGSAIEAVDDELATLFLQYLSGKELGLLSCCSKRWLRLTGTAELWRNALVREFGGACRANSRSMHSSWHLRADLIATLWHGAVLGYRRGWTRASIARGAHRCGPPQQREPRR